VLTDRHRQSLAVDASAPLGPIPLAPWQVLGLKHSSTPA
jgi:hypothetical protein